MDRHNENDDMHMKDTQNTEAQEEACAGAEAGDAGDAVQTLPENLESLCHEHVCPNCTEKRDADDARLRAAAEMDNFKKRLKREHEEQIRYAAEKVMSDLLPTLDNLDLALQYGSKDEACKDMLQGVRPSRPNCTKPWALMPKPMWKPGPWPAFCRAATSWASVCCARPRS